VVSCVARADGVAYALAHPRRGKTTDTDTSIVFEVSPTKARAIHTFAHEVTGICELDGALFCVDGDADLHEYTPASGTWKHHAGVGAKVARINQVRATGGHVYGLTGDGIIYDWEPRGRRWTALTKEIDGLYLHDIADDARGTRWVTGSEGFLGVLTKGAIQKREVAVQTHLTSVLPLADGRLVITGWEGTVLVGPPDQLRAVGRGEESCLDAVWWNERVLVAASKEILELQAGKLVSFAKQAALQLATNGQRLWRADSKGLAWLDARTWQDVTLAV